MRGRAAAILAAGALSLASLSTPRARAQEAPPAPADAAQRAASEAAALALQADALAAEGRLEEACQAYRASWARRRDPRVAARLGELELSRGNAAPAATYLSLAALAPAELGGPEQLAALTARLAEARQRAGELRVRVSSLLAEVWVDGARAGYSVEPALFVPPGQHVVEIRAAGYLPERREISIAAGESQEISATLTRSGSHQPLKQEPAPPEPASRTAPPPRVLGGGLAPAAFTLNPRPQRRGKSIPFILGGLASSAMLGVLGGSLVVITDSPESNAMGAGFLIGGGVLALGTVTYALWPQATTRSAGLAFTGAF